MLRVLILLFAMVVTVTPVHGKSAEPGWGVGYGTPSEAKSISLDADAAKYGAFQMLGDFDSTKSFSHTSHCVLNRLSACKGSNGD
jgi:hypothetical protein